MTMSNHRRLVESLLESDSRKEKQKQWVRRVADVEKDFLSRTVYITDVVDLNGRDGELKRVLQKQFGPIEVCIAESRGDDNPREKRSARVRFRRRQDAEKVFRGNPLLSARPLRRYLKCPSLGSFVSSKNGKQFSLRPSYRYPGMLEKVLRGGIIELPIHGLSLGHYASPERDLCLAGALPPEWLEITSRPDLQPTLRIDLPHRTMELEIDRDHDENGDFLFEDSHFFAHWTFKALLQPIEICRENGEYSLLIQLRYPPKYEIDRPKRGLGYSDDESDRSRCLDFDGLLLGACFRLPLASIEPLLLNERRLSDLKAAGLLPQDLLEKELQTRHVTFCDAQLEEELVRIRLVQGSTVAILVRALLDAEKTNGWYALNNRYHDPSDLVERSLFDVVADQDACRVEKSLRQWLSTHGQTAYPAHYLMQLLESDLSTPAAVQVPEYCFLVPRIRLTPSRQVLLGQDTEMSNRVVRRFVRDEGFHADHFLRVQVAEEDGRRIFIRDLSASVVERFKRILSAGVVINGLRYEFFAFSSSQIKDMSLWMVHAIEPWTVSSMRQALGDFSGCQSPSYFAARIGQCFSTTYQGNHGDCDLRIQMIPDISTDHPRKMHSDGTGVIRREFLSSLLNNMENYQLGPEDASIVQFRCGGAKGTAVGWDMEMLVRLGRLDSETERTADILLRPSMIKFGAPFKHLEICSIGSAVPYYLNRNVILLLMKHGVPKEVFVTMQENMLDGLRRMLVNRQEALFQLRRLAGVDLQMKRVLLKLLENGVAPDRDPFLYSCLNEVRVHHEKGLRRKARIAVKDGVVLMGSVDETGLVPEGCVFVNVRRETDESGERSYAPVVGPVMVTKHPVMHPGDVRMLLAIDVPELRLLRNVILFSRFGDRPEPDKMAGSDLDGDEFAVTWDSRLFLGIWNQCRKDSHGGFTSAERTFSRGARPTYNQRRQRGAASCLDSTRTVHLAMQNYAEDARTLMESNAFPLDFLPDSVLDDNVTEDVATFDNSRGLSRRLIDHFFFYANRDCLGQIGMLWQDWAAIEGADSTECTKLAEAHSVAVDFGKSGVPPAIPKDILLGKNRPRPHWREKQDAPSFRDSGIIGKLYDDLNKHVFAEGHDEDDPRPRPRSIAMRRIDKYGQVLCILNDASDVRASLDSVYDHTLMSIDVGCSSREEGVDWDPLLRDMHVFANEQRRAFESEVVALMNRHGLRSEGGVFTGSIRKYAKIQKERDVAELVTRERQQICLRYRELFSEYTLTVTELLSKSTGLVFPFERTEGGRFSKAAVRHALVTAATEGVLQTTLDVLIRRVAGLVAVAFYRVTYNPDFRYYDDQKEILFAFPWIVADVRFASNNIPRDRI